MQKLIQSHVQSEVEEERPLERKRQRQLKGRAETSKDQMKAKFALVDKRELDTFVGLASWPWQGDQGRASEPWGHET